MNGDVRLYEHPIFADLLKELWFSGSNSIGVRKRTLFVTSMPSVNPQTLHQEPEIPAAMLALVATAVRFY